MKATKATLLVLGVLAAVASFGCSDDNSGRKIGARCTPIAFQYNGTDCQRDNVVSCVDNVVTETVCDIGCEIVNNTAQCIGNGHSSCGDVTEVGMCVGKTLKFCNDGQLETKKCDVACGEVEGNAGSYYDCIDKAPSKGCGTITEIGICQGNTLKYCDNDVLKSEVCEFGCGEFEDKDGKFYKCNASECGDIDAKGVCKGNQLTYCNKGKLVTEVCAAGCDEFEDKNGKFFDCVKAECGDIDEKGVCDGLTLKYCDDGRLVEQICDIACAEAITTEGAQMNQCVGCDFVMDRGVCLTDGSLVYCDGNVSQKVPCDNGCKMTSTDFAYCYVPCDDVTSVGVCSEDKRSVSYCNEDDMLLTEYCDEGAVCSELENADHQKYFDCVMKPVDVVDCDPTAETDACAKNQNGKIVCDADSKKCVEPVTHVDVEDCDPTAETDACAKNQNGKTVCDAGSRICVAPEPVNVDDCDPTSGTNVCAANTNGKTICDAGSKKCVAPEPVNVDDCDPTSGTNVCAANMNGKTICDPKSKKCVAADACEGIDARGICEGDDFKSCKDGALVIEHCLSCFDPRVSDPDSEAAIECITR